MIKTKKRAVKPARGQARRRILDAAVQAFAEKGFEAASTREISNRAGIDQGLLTYHYPNKDLLWRAAADQVFDSLGKRLELPVDSLQVANPKERAREAIREYVRWAAQHPEFIRFLVDAGNRTDARSRWLVDTHMKPRFEFMRDYGVVSAAGIDEASAPHAFYTVIGASALIFAIAPNCRRLTGLDPRKRDTIEAHADFVANLIVP